MHIISGTIGRGRVLVKSPGESRVYDRADGDEQQGNSVRFVEELDRDVIDRSLVDAGEAVGRGTEPVAVDMVGGDGIFAIPAGGQPL